MHAAGRRRRHRDDVVAAIAAAHHRPLDGAVVLQVVAGHQPAGVAHRGGDLVGDRSFVEGARAVAARSRPAWRRDRTAPGGRPRASSAPSRLEENLRRRGPARQPRAAMSGSESAMSSLDRKPSRASSIAGAISCASVNLPEPYFSMRQRQARDGAGHADGEAVLARLRRIGLALARRETSRAWSRPARSRDSRWRCRCVALRRDGSP